MTVEAPRVHLITPQQAQKRISEFGYVNWTKVPLGHSHYLDALVIAATSSQPIDLVNLLQQTHRSVRDRS